MDDEQLPARKTRRNHAEEFAGTYFAEARKLMGFLMKIGATHHEAADAAQRAFELAWQSWPVIREPVPWLRKVAIRTYYQQTRLPEELTDNPPDQPVLLCPSVQVEITERTRAMIDLLATLPDKQRMTIALKADGLTIQEIADTLGMTPDAARQNLHRARAGLKDHLRTSQGGAV